MSNEGKFVYHAINPEDADLYDPIFEESLFPTLVDLLNQRYALPRDIHLVAEQCDIANAGYSKAKHAAILCYELARAYDRVAATAYPDPASRRRFVSAALVFAAVHEIGHALIAELDLGVVGGEEDAVDDFATLFLVSVHAEEQTLAEAELLLRLPSASTHSDPHSSAGQRACNIMCVVLGSDVARWSGHLGRYVPEERSVHCPDEFAKKSKGWASMLRGHTKTP